ncbi:MULTISPECIES: exodeoxyribonuclease III [Lawsonella]|uniref:Exodeoxyribonuclease III n=1 Tax=Lawsonella clevelandensis TaxID=1528099 RepID=A0A2W5IE34_9ACTN|nr:MULTISPECIES: exodeoxyribonuclease III [Lawsonella]PZP89247.1 MAG: exodeoxyribonuclease III [Lawsonella clevelandensis]
MSFTVTSVNVNGIRAATRVRSEENKGFLAWLNTTSSDVVCIQEVRATPEQALTALAPALVDNGGSWYFSMQEAAAKGRAGVGILSRQEPIAVRTGINVEEFADAGRYIEADFPIGGRLAGAVDGDLLTVASLYLPSGEVDTPRQDEKYRFMDGFATFLNQRTTHVSAGTAPQTVVCGDWNIAHREEDLKNFKANTTKSGFLPVEREWMTSLFGPNGVGVDTAGNPTGWTDAQRYLQPEGCGPYSWWSYRGKAFDNDAGWRIDYQAITPGLVDHLQEARVERADAYALRWSDHAPVTVTYK